jgi:fermentation-respiration switch protein FrsA (DUF1100 family)
MKSLAEGNKVAKQSRKTWRYWLNLAGFGLLIFAIPMLGFVVKLTQARAYTLVHPGRGVLERTPADLGIEDWELVTFPASDGLQITAFYWPPAPDVDGATLIYVHGLGANRTQLLDEAALWRSYGIGALLIDQRAHGESQGDFTTMGYLEANDVRGAYEYLTGHPEVNSERIGIVGHSMGGSTAIQAMAQMPELRLLLAESTFTSLDDFVNENIQGVTGLPAFPFGPLVVWFAEREVGLDLDLVKSAELIGTIAPRPVMIVHGDQDPLIFVNNAYELYEAAGEPKELYVVVGGVHGSLLASHPQEFEMRVSAFLKAYLLPANE